MSLTVKVTAGSIRHFPAAFGGSCALGNPLGSILSPVALASVQTDLTGKDPPPPTLGLTLGLRRPARGDRRWEWWLPLQAGDKLGKSVPMPKSPRSHASGHFKLTSATPREDIFKIKLQCFPDFLKMWLETLSAGGVGGMELGAARGSL